MLHDEALRDQLRVVGLDEGAGLDLFPIAWRIAFQIPLCLTEQQGLISLMQQTAGRFTMIERHHQRERNLARRPFQESLWFRAKAFLRSQSCARLREPPQPPPPMPGPETLVDFPVLGRVVFGPEASPAEGRSLAREMIRCKAALDEIDGYVEGELRVFARLAEKTAFLWACQGHLYPTAAALISAQKPE